MVGIFLMFNNSYKFNMNLIILLGFGFVNQEFRMYSFRERELTYLDPNRIDDDTLLVEKVMQRRYLTELI